MTHDDHELLSPDDDERTPVLVPVLVPAGTSTGTSTSWYYPVLVLDLNHESHKSQLILKSENIFLAIELSWFLPIRTKSWLKRLNGLCIPIIFSA
jgi:hypothetical protein